MKVETIGGKILATTIIVYLLWTGTASGETNTYKFDPDQSMVIRSFFTSDTYTLIGAFQLTVDVNSGSFDWVDATFSDDPNLQTGDLRELFYMDELVGDVVNDTTIEFELPPGHPVHQSYDIDITLTLQNNQVHLTGQRFPLMLGEPGYTLDAVANLVKVVYVDTDAPGGGDGTSWATAFRYLQDALFNTVPPAEIRVAQGIYKPHLNTYSAAPPSRTDTFQLKNGVTIKGGYAGLGQPDPDVRDISLHQTILSGDMNGDDEPNFVNNGDNSYRVVTGSGTNETAVIDGFVITAGNANFEDFSECNGGGMYNDHGSPTIMNCTFMANYAGNDDGGGRGGGMYNYNNSSPTITNCRFVGNCAIALDGDEGCGGGMGNWDSNPKLTGCTFTGNTSGRDGGGIWNDYSNLVLIDCTFTGNLAREGGSGSYGGGMYNYGCNVVLVNCIFSDNTARSSKIGSWGGGMHNDTSSDVTATNCMFSGNSAQSGGGMSNVMNNRTMLANCALIENVAVDGGAIYINGDFSGTFTDCVFENNTAAMEGGAILHKGFGELNIIRCEFRDGSAERGGAIYNLYASLLLSQCILVNNQADYAGAIDTDGDITLTNCLLANNQAVVWGGALSNMENTSRSVNCTFVGNSANYGGAIFSNIECDTTAINSIFWNNTAQTGSQIATSGSHGGSTLTINNCDIEHLLDGLHVPDGCTLIWGGGNINDEPLFTDSNNGNYRLSIGSPCIDTGDNTAIPPSELNDLDGNPRVMNGAVDMGAYEFQGIQILYVDDDAAQFGNGTSWATAFKYLQDALFNAVAPAEIRVAQGIYKPHLNTYSAAPPSRADTFQLKNGVTIKGGYAGLGQQDPDARDISLYETILSGDINGDDIEVAEPCDLLTEPTRADNSYHVVMGVATDETLVLDGLTITAGNANGSLPHHGAGGIAAFYGDIINCTISGNSAIENGGGMGCHGNIINCVITWNSAGSFGGGLHRCNAELYNCIISWNWAGKYGGGMYNQNYPGESVPIIENCTFSNNSAGQRGGGMYNDYCSSPPRLSNCKFTENSAILGGGMCNYESSTVLTNCIFSGNSASQNGGGMFSDTTPCQVKVINCTFSHNSAGQYGGATCWGDESEPQLVNSILWYNTAAEGPQIAVDTAYYYSLSVSHCNIQGGKADIFGYSPNVEWGVGNIDADPLFVDADGIDNIVGTEDDNLRLSFGSPCIDTGDPGYVAGPNETDLDGNPRVIGGRIDMGAYEFFGPVYVDDDGPNDPGPGDPQVSDPLEDGTQDHPFDTIQEGINIAKDGYIVLVRQGSYSEPGTGNYIDFYGKNINLTSTDPTDWDIVDNTVILGYVQFSGTEDPNCKFAGFKIQNIEGAIYGNHTRATISHCNISGNGPCGATVIKDCDGTISNCLITDNTTFFKCGVFPVVFGCDGVIKNCTIANNDSGLSVGTATIKNCIIYNNIGSQLDVGDFETLNISYCNLQGGLEGITGGGIVNWGPGNINTDPCFVRLGYWITDEMTLVEGDYHLRSEGWRWNTEGQSWTYDFVTSRCIDAGNPASDLGDELMSVPRDPDNIWGINLRINMGAYGGTDQAGMPPHGWALMADLNNNGIVNFLDCAHQTLNWQATAPEQPGDQNRDGVVNKMDLARLAEDWLQVTVWCEY